MEEEVKEGQKRIEELQSEITAQDTKWQKDFQRVFKDIQAQISARSLEWPQQRVEKLTLEVTESKMKIMMLEKKAQDLPKVGELKHVCIKEVQRAADLDYNLKQQRTIAFDKLS